LGVTPQVPGVGSNTEAQYELQNNLAHALSNVLRVERA
jgi:hypothetical protein